MDFEKQSVKQEYVDWMLENYTAGMLPAIRENMILQCGLNERATLDYVKYVADYCGVLDKIPVPNKKYRKGNNQVLSIDCCINKFDKELGLNIKEKERIRKSWRKFHAIKKIMANKRAKESGKESQ